MGVVSDESDIRTINELRDEVAALRLLVAMQRSAPEKSYGEVLDVRMAPWPENVRVWT